MILGKAKKGVVAGAIADKGRWGVVSYIGLVPIRIGDESGLTKITVLLKKKKLAKSEEATLTSSLSGLGRTAVDE